MRRARTRGERKRATRGSEEEEEEKKRLALELVRHARLEDRSASLRVVLCYDDPIRAPFPPRVAAGAMTVSVSVSGPEVEGRHIFRNDEHERRAARFLEAGLPNSWNGMSLPNLLNLAAFFDAEFAPPQGWEKASREEGQGENVSRYVVPSLHSSRRISLARRTAAFAQFKAEVESFLLRNAVHFRERESSSRYLGCEFHAFYKIRPRASSAPLE